jgi:hypothetical protein
MATLQNMANGVRERLNDPLPQAPGLRHVFRAVTDSAQARVNQSSASGKAWSIQEVRLNVTSGTADYVLPTDSSFGKPLSVITYYPQNPSTVQRYVDFSELNNLNYNWSYPQNLASWLSNWDGSPNTALRMAFYRKPDDTSLWVRVLPTPQLAATYIVLGSQGTWADDASIDSSPLLAQFHPLIEMDAVELLLAHAAWFTEDTKEGREANTNRRKELGMSQASMKSKYEDDFDRFIRSTNDPGITTRASSFGDCFWG